MTASQVKLLNQLRQQATGGTGGASQIGIEINKGDGVLRIRGAAELIAKGYAPYLFRYTRKRNRVNIGGSRSHGPVRKGWNMLGKAGTAAIGDDETLLIDAHVIDRTYDGDQKYRHEARYFVKDAPDREGGRKASYGKIRIVVAEKQGKLLVPRKVRLLYGIAFAPAVLGNRKLLDKSTLVTPIVPFHVSTRINNGSYSWIFER